MDLVYANMELLTLCTKYHTALKVTEDHCITVKLKVEGIYKKLNQFVPTMWSLEKLARNGLNNKKFHKRSIVQIA